MSQLTPEWVPRVNITTHCTKTGLLVTQNCYLWSRGSRLEFRQLSGGLEKKNRGNFVLFNDTSKAHWFSYHQLFDVKHMVIVTYFFFRNPLSPHRLLFPIKNDMLQWDKKSGSTCILPPWDTITLALWHDTPLSHITLTLVIYLSK